jgi:Asp/Glu/hydantoin racemase
MGCAGMARYRQSLEDTLGVPVIDPSQAAVANAIAAVRLGYSNSTMKA